LPSGIGLVVMMVVASGVVEMGVQVIRSWDCIVYTDVGTCLALQDNSSSRLDGVETA
jgi:hypothetical protein